MNVEIVSSPENALVAAKDLSNYATAITELAESTKKLDELAEQAKQFKVINSKEDFRKAGDILAELRGMKKHGDHKITPFVDLLNSAIKHVRQYRTDYEAKVQSIDDSLNPQLVEWDRKEKEETKREQDRENERLRKEAEARAAEQKREADKKAEEERKAKQQEINAAARSGEVGKREAAALKKKADEEAERTKQANAQQAQTVVANAPTVKVKSSTPRFAGMRQAVHWHWKMVDITKVPREKLYPNKQQDGTYDTAKFPQITALVSETKDKAKAEAACPGIQVWSSEKL